MQNEEVMKTEDYTGADLVLSPLATMMRIELIVNDQSGVILLHDKPFPGILHWMEYDSDLNVVTLVLRDGRSIDLGMKIHPDIGECLKDTKLLYTVLTSGKDIQDMFLVPVVIRDV